MKKPEFVPGDVILEVESKVHLHKIILRKDTLEIYRGELHFIFDLEEITSITPVKGSGGLFTAKPAEIRIVGQSRGGDRPPLWPISFQYNQNDEITKLVNAFYEIRRTLEKQQQTDRAKERERALDYDSAIGIWEELGEIEEAARVRKLKAEEGSVKVSQKVVHGDEVTEIKDSVINRSNVGAGGKSKSEELREAKALLDDGIIDDDEFKQMKKEILGK